jgi:neutral ceramidase
MGYANTAQVGTGLRQRLYSRAFIIGDPTNAADRFVYLVVDTQSGDTAVRYGVLSALAALGSNYSVYGQQNLALTGTHSHSGPGAWLNYLLPTITSLGFDKQSYQAIVDGAVLSVQRAHESLTLGTLSFGSTTLTGAANANINRSPYAYLANPAAERAQYTDDVDKTMTMIKFTRASDNLDIGVLTWFPVHGTSMLGNNTLISGDNKGVAADLLEKSLKASGGVAPDFVAGFSQANVGDTTPNILGAWCDDGSGLQCSFEKSLCGNTSEACHGRGPHFQIPDNGASSCFEIGTRQSNAAASLLASWDSTSTAITGSAVRSFHTFQDMTSFSFTLPNGTVASTCPAALGYSFAAGTSDWPGAFDFTQGDSGAPNANPLWQVVVGAIKEPSEAQKACQAPKPILLDVGEIHTPYDWAPNIVDIQVLRVGQLFLIISPGEATTMSGRRWKAAVGAAASAAGLTDGATPLVVLGGPANSYTHYLATEEEYGIQRYEGASTLYGPNTLNAYINLTTSYLPYLAATPPAAPLTPGPSPPNNVDRALSFISPVVFDAAPLGKSFGAVLADVPSTVARGSWANVTFVGANPRNDLRLEQSYAVVEQQAAGGAWTTARDDSDWDLIFNWARTSTVLGTSTVTMSWLPGADAVPGRYRIRYYGAAKTPVLETINQIGGVSGTFTVT